MISFFVDTALSYIRIALFRDDKIIDCINEKCDKNMSSVFDLRVRDLFDRNNLNFNQVDKIYTVTGPGSFTGIRVGMTFSKVLAFSLGKRIIPISELQVLASSNNDFDCVASLIDARRGYVYAGVYDKNLDVVYNDRYILLDDFLNSNPGIKCFGYDNFESVDVIEPSIDFEKIILKNRDIVGIDYHILSPNYLKLTEAEENLRKKTDNDC